MTTVDTRQDLDTDADAGTVSAARLVAGLAHDGSAPDLEQHRQSYPRPDAYASTAGALLERIEQSGLRGRGGAAFPTATKLRAVAGRANPVVVVNSTEGEPASVKDALLVTTNPHLVIDGALVAAAAVGASTVRLCVAADNTAGLHRLRSALAERHGREPLPDIRVLASPLHYVVGEETALVNWLNGERAVPTGTRPTQRGMHGHPTAVQNTETVAHLAQIACFGPEWFRGLGTAEEPGTALCTVMRGDGSPQVIEAALGTPLVSVIDAAGASLESSPGVLLGGYFGAWITTDEAAGALLSNVSLRPLGAAVGAGTIAPLPTGTCGWCETTRLLRWMAGESAGQCGVCVHGLVAIAGAAEDLAHGRGSIGTINQLERWAGQVEGRGGCRLPDGAVRLLRSALRVHRDALYDHLDYRGCKDGSRGFLPVPDHRSAPWR